MHNMKAYGVIQTDEVEPRRWMPDGSQRKKLIRRVSGREGLEDKHRLREVLSYYLQTSRAEKWCTC